MSIEQILERIAIALEKLVAVPPGKAIVGETAADPTPAAKRTRKPAATVAATPEDVVVPTAVVAEQAVPAADDKVYAETDVRAALVALASRKGKAESLKILKKHSPTEVISGLPKDKYAAVIHACEAVK